jgi:hypothetical protein
MSRSAAERLSFPPVQSRSTELVHGADRDVSHDRMQSVTEPRAAQHSLGNRRAVDRHAAPRRGCTPGRCGCRSVDPGQGPPWGTADGQVVCAMGFAPVVVLVSPIPPLGESTRWRRVPRHPGDRWPRFGVGARRLRVGLPRGPVRRCARRRSEPRRKTEVTNWISAMLVPGPSYHHRPRSSLVDRLLRNRPVAQRVPTPRLRRPPTGDCLRDWVPMSRVRGNRPRSPAADVCDSPGGTRGGRRQASASMTGGG